MICVKTYCAFVFVLLVAAVLALLFGGMSDGGILAGFSDGGIQQAGWSWTPPASVLAVL